MKIKPKRDKMGNTYTLQPNGDVWCFLAKKGYAELVGTIKNNKLIVFKNRRHWWWGNKGWRLHYPVLVWTKSFRFKYVRTQTAVTPRGTAWTGMLKRSFLLRQPRSKDSSVVSVCIKRRWLEEKH